MLSPLDRALSWFLPRRPLSPHETLQLRILTGATGLGLLVAVAATVTTRLTSPGLPVAFIVAFGVACVALLFAIRSGASMRLLRRTTLIVLGLFFLAQTLQTEELLLHTLKWLALLPLLAMTLADPRDPRDGGERPVAAMWGGGGLAVVLATVIFLCNAYGWTGHFDDTEVMTGGISISGLIDLVLFIASVAGLLSVHQYAVEQTKRELSMVSSFLPMCAWCRRVRDDERWMVIEDYMTQHLDRQMTHGICPECESSMR